MFRRIGDVCVRGTPRAVALHRHEQGVEPSKRTAEAPVSGPHPRHPLPRETGSRRRWWSAGVASRVVGVARATAPGVDGRIGGTSSHGERTRDMTVAVCCLRQTVRARAGADARWRREWWPQTIQAQTHPSAPLTILRRLARRAFARILSVSNRQPIAPSSRRDVDGGYGPVPPGSHVRHNVTSRCHASALPLRVVVASARASQYNGCWTRYTPEPESVSRMHLALASLPLLLQWNLNPALLLGIAALVAAYIWGFRSLRMRSAPGFQGSRAHIAWFTAGTVILFLALCSPLDALSDTYLFSAHMVQHMLIAVVVPPLWLLGVPPGLLDPLLRRPAVERTMRLLTAPPVAFTLFNGFLWLWHAPALYDATLHNESIHILEHLIFIITGVLFWWPVIAPARQIPRISLGYGVLYLFLACQPMVALGALLTFSGRPLYQPYTTAPRIWGSTPLGDQQLGGLIMWLPTNVPYVIGLSALFFKWVGEHDRGERLAAGELDEFHVATESAGRDTNTQV